MKYILDVGPDNDTVGLLPIRCDVAGYPVAKAFTTAELNIYRLGDPERQLLITYPLQSTDACGRAVFQLDSALFDLVDGRWEAELVTDDVPCGSVELRTGGTCCGVSTELATVSDQVDVIGEDVQLVLPNNYEHQPAPQSSP